MFLGSYRTTFTGKNRIILPRKFRQELLGYEIILIEGLDGGVWGFSKEFFEELGKDILKLPLQESRGRKVRRQFFGSAEQMDLDKQGRFIIPDRFVDNAFLAAQAVGDFDEKIREVSLKPEILIIGAGDHFEIWNPVEYEKLMELSKNIL